MPGHRATVLLLCGAVLGVVGLLVAAPPDPPVSLRRVFVSPQKLAEELARPRQGPLISLPRDDFEALVRRATTPPAPPRLVEAAYEATLVDGDLVGSARWNVVQSADGLLPLGACNLALTQLPQRRPEPIALAVALVSALGQAPWLSPVALPVDIPVGDFDGKGPALLLHRNPERTCDSPHRQTLDLGWKAHGEARPDGWHFDLRWPAAPVAVLDLVLPNDTAVSATGVNATGVTVPDVLVAGPFPVGDRRRWRVYGGGLAQLDLVLQPARPGVAPLPLVHTVTTQTLCPDAVEVRFELDVEVQHQGLRQLVFECDPDLEPFDVTGRHLEGWEVNRGNPQRILVRLREPVQSEKFTIDCLAPLRPAGPNAQARRSNEGIPWTSPGLRLVGAVPRGETLQLRLHPDLQLADWKPGDFRLENADTFPDPERGGLYQLTLRGGGVLADPTPGQAVRGPDAPPRRPSATVRAAGTLFRVRQYAWWHVEPGRQTLRLTLAYEVLQGQLLQPAVRLPPGWEVAGVEVAGKDAPKLAGRSVRTGPKGSDLVVDLQSPLRPQVAATLTVELRPTGGSATLGRELPFPDAIPLGARFREGALAVVVDEQAVAVTVRASLPEGIAEDSPWPNPNPTWCYPYRGVAPTGVLTLHSRTPEIRARCTSEVRQNGAQVSVESRLQIEAEAGSPETVVVGLSGNAEGWEWRPGPGASLAGPPVRALDAELAGHLALLAGDSPLGTAALGLAAPRGPLWRLTLARPLHGRDNLVLLGTGQAHRVGASWEVPLPVVPGAARLDGEVALHLPGLVGLNAVGLREAVPTGRARNTGKVLRYTTPAPSLAFNRTESRPADAGPRADAGRSPAALVDDACLTTTLGPGPLLHHHIRFRLAGWSDSTLVLGLPAGAQPLAARVDGVWLDRLPTEGDGVRLPVPAVPGGGEPSHRYEVVYDTPAAVPWVRGTLSAPLPTLAGPVPLHVRRVWRLPPGLMPLEDGTWRRLAGTGEVDGVRHTPGDVFRLIQPTGPWSASGSTEQRQALADGVLGLRRKYPGETLPLRRMLTELAPWFPRRAFVIDTHALAAVGRGPGTGVRLEPPGDDDGDRLPWEDDAVGLATLPAPAAPLLTTQQQRDRWARDGFPLPADVEEAVAEAVRAGRDPSGRFRALWDWPDGSPAEAPELPPGSWTEWEPTASAGDTLVVVRSGSVQMAAVGLALLAVLIVWRPGWRKARTRLAVLALVLTATALALLALPTVLQPLAWWPFLAAAAAGLFWHLNLAWARPRPSAAARPGPRVRAALPVAGLLLALVLVHAGHGDTPPAPAPVTVFVVTGADGRETVFAPPELLEQLRARVAGDTPQAAVPLTADYEGKVVGSVAPFTAVYRVWSTTPGAALVVLPLEGVALDGEVQVDGVRVAPVASPPPLPGIAVPTRGQGWHEVRVVFKAPVHVGPSGDAEVQFGAPRLSVNRLRLRLPAQAVDAQAVGRQGGQRVVSGGVPRGGSADEPILEADLGRLVGPVGVRWSTGPRQGRPALVQFREAWLWDLGPEAATLTGQLLFQVTQGTTPRLEVELPADLVVRSAAAARLRDWHVAHEGRELLRLEFTGPVSGDVAVALELVPRHPLPATLTLPVPTPRGQAVKDGGYLAYRTAGHGETQRLSTLNLTGLGQAEPFAPFWPRATQPASASLDYACVFSSGDGKRPVVTLHLTPLTPQVTAQQEVAVSVRPRQADVRVTLDFAVADGNVAVVEWDLQPARTRWYQPARTLQVTRVTGAEGLDVRAWSLEGDHLVVWLGHGVGTGRLEVAGWLPLTPTAGGSRLDLPRLSVAGARTTTLVRLLPEHGAALEALDLHQLTPLAGGTGPFVMGIDLSRVRAGAAPAGLAFGTAGSDYRGSWLVRAGSAPPGAQVATLLDVRDRQVTFTTTVDVRVQRGGSRTVTLRLRDWDREVTLQTPKDVRWREVRAARGERAWELELPEARAGADEGRRLLLGGSLPVDEVGEGVAVPDVRVAEAVRSERVVVSVGGELVGAGPTPGWERVEPGQLPVWLGDARRLLRAGAGAWVPGPGAAGPLRLALREQAGGAPPRLLLADHRVSLAEGGTWAVASTLWFWHESGAESLTWPADVGVLALAVDGVPVPSGQTEGRSLWLPLSDKAGPRRVQVWWRWAGAEGGAGRGPRLEGAELSGAVAGPVLWTVRVPPGVVVAEASGLAAGPGALASLELARAEASLQLAVALGERRESADVAAREAALGRSRRYLRRAEVALALAGEGGGDKGPGGQPLVEWLRERQRTLAGRGGSGVVTVESEEGSGEEGFVPGTPYRGRVEAGVVPGLTLRSGGGEGEGVVAAGRCVGALAGLALLALLPVCWPALRPLWPEQLGALGVLGWMVAGPTPVVVLLGLAWGAGRMAGVGVWAGRWRRGKRG